MIRAFIEKCAAKMTDDCSEPVVFSDEDSEPVMFNFTQGSEPVVLSDKDSEPVLFNLTQGSEPLVLSDEDSEPVLFNFTQGSEPVLLSFSQDDFEPKLLDFSEEESEPGNTSSCIVPTTSTPKKVAEATLQTGTYSTMTSRADLELSGGSAGPSYMCSILQDSGLTLEESSSGKQ